MNIDGVKNGIVLDHIQAGQAMAVYHALNLDGLDACVAIIMNVKSAKYGKKDILKIDAEIDMDLETLGYLDPNITVNIVKSEKMVEKKHLSLPKTLRDVIACKNPRCITTVEPNLTHVFHLSGQVYRCAYCETAHEKN